MRPCPTPAESRARDVQRAAELYEESGPGLMAIFTGQIAAERTVSIDTTAAGGNANLTALEA